MKNPDEKVKIVFQLVKRKAYEVSDYCMYQRQSMVTVYRLAVQAAAFFFSFPTWSLWLPRPDTDSLRIN